MKCSKYFGAKWRGFIKSESILAPKGSSHFKTQNIRCDNVMIINDASSGVNKLKDSFNDDARVVIYDRHMFIVQATARVTAVAKLLVYHSIVWWHGISN